MSILQSRDGYLLKVVTCDAFIKCKRHTKTRRNRVTIFFHGDSLISTNNFIDSMEFHHQQN